MFKGIEISTNERQFLFSALKSKLRLNGRKFNEPRIPEITLGEEYGHITVKLGKTLIVARISAEITAPFEDRPFEGLFQVTTEISPMASALFDPSSRQSSDDELLISRAVEKAVRRSGALDLESLCIIAGAKCWSIRADLHYLDYDGGFIDASCVAVMAGLLHFRKNDLTVSGEQVILHDVNEREPVELSVLHIPICVTFAFFNPEDIETNIKGEGNTEIHIVDPDAQEEAMKDGALTVCLNKNREVCQISKAGGLPMDALTLMGCSQQAYDIAVKITDMIKDVVEKDYKKRNEGIQYKLRAENDR